MISHSIAWTDTTKKPTGKALIAKIVSESRMVVHHHRGADGFLSLLYIELHGAIAAVPPLKNSKIPGKNFPNPDFISKLQAMDALFNNAIEDQLLGGYFGFGTLPVALAFIPGARNRKFDLVNGLETVQDWLEPRTKAVGRNKYGWGIGVIADDAQIVPVTLHSAQLGAPVPYTRIVVRRWSDVRREAAEFVTGAFLP